MRDSRHRKGVGGLLHLTRGGKADGSGSVGHTAHRITVVATEGTADRGPLDRLALTVADHDCDKAVLLAPTAGAGVTDNGADMNGDWRWFGIYGDADIRGDTGCAV